jgi:hypothetical protein
MACGKQVRAPRIFSMITNSHKMPLFKAAPEATCYSSEWHILCSSSTKNTHPALKMLIYLAVDQQH